MVLVSAVTRVKNEYLYMRAAGGQARALRITRGYLPRLRFLLALPLLLALAICLRVVLKILKPLVHIRFGRVWAFQLGSLTVPTELYLCEVDAGMHPRRSFDIFYHYRHEHYNQALVTPRKPEDLIANKQVDVMFRRRLRVAEIARPLDRLNRLLPGGTKEFCVKSCQPVDLHGLLDRYPPHLAFTPEEEERGKSGLREMGIEPDSRFVCFHARDGMWIRRAHPRVVSVYGDWTLAESRNSFTGNYLLAAEKLTDLGYYAIRMGKYVAEPISTPNPRVIDYATIFHSDFMDVFLSARCAFFIGQDSGMTSLPMIFRRPMALVNIFPLEQMDYCTNKPNIFIPKMLYSAEKGRLLTFRETMEFGLGGSYLKTPEDQAICERLSLEIVENTPEEIAGVALEMHQNLQSIFESTDEDEQLQSRFLSLVRRYQEIAHVERGLESNLRIGAHFLRIHQDWLE